MKVKATRFGYYGHAKRKPDSIFELKPYKDSQGKIVSTEQQFSSRWMEKVDDATPVTPHKRNMPMGDDQEALSSFKKQEVKEGDATGNSEVL